jgi:hypothetical protein
MVSNPVSEICEHVAEVQALLDDHRAGGKDSAADVVAKAQAVLSEPELLRAMSDTCRRTRRRGLELRDGADHKYFRERDVGSPISLNEGRKR